jgi:hypothetical protein
VADASLPVADYATLGSSTHPKSTEKSPRTLPRTYGGVSTTCGARRFRSPVSRADTVHAQGIAHAYPFINCTKGLSGVNGGTPFCPNLAGLAAHGVSYLDA